MEEELIELSSDENVRIIYNEITSNSVIHFGFLKIRIPKIVKVAVSTLLPFASTTYMRNGVFISYSNKKTNIGRN